MHDLIAKKEDNSMRIICENGIYKLQVRGRFNNYDLWSTVYEGENKGMVDVWADDNDMISGDAVE